MKVAFSWRRTYEERIYPRIGERWVSSADFWTGEHFSHFRKNILAYEQRNFIAIDEAQKRGSRARATDCGL